MDITKALIECQKSANMALADMDRLWACLSGISGKRTDTVKEFLRLLNRVAPQSKWDPEVAEPNGIFGLPLINDDAFYESATQLLARYQSGSAEENHIPPLWLRLVPGWHSMIDALGLKKNLIAVSVAVNNGEGGPASSSVVLNSRKNIADLSTLTGADRVRTFVVTLQRPDASGIQQIPALPYISQGIRFRRSESDDSVKNGPYLFLYIKPDNGEGSVFGRLLLPDFAAESAEYNCAWLAAFARWLVGDDAVAAHLGDLKNSLVNGKMESLPQGTPQNQIDIYLEFIQNFCPGGHLPDVLDTIFCPAVLWSVDPAHQGSAANCYFIFDSALTDEQARVLLHASQTLLAGIGQFSTGHFLDSARLEELTRAEQMLLKIQRPLDELSDAFKRVQAEAQEMQAILNDPEEGIFKAHKALAPLFYQGHAIQISNYLSLTPEHNWSTRVSLEKLEEAYCYALACIFGVQNRLLESPSHAALVEKTRGALREKRESGVNGELIQLLTVLFGLNDLRNRMGSRVEIEDSVQPCWDANNHEETVSEVQERYSSALSMLKRIAFTPFKSFGREWPTAPVQVASVTRSILNRTESLNVEVPPTLPPQDTPFSQHAILSFIIGIKSEIKSLVKTDYPVLGLDVVASRVVLAATSKSFLSEYRLKLARRFFGTDDESNDPSGEQLAVDLEILQDCIRSTIRHGIVGKVMGSFHGIFQDLLRHGLNLATADEYRKDAWVLLAPPTPTWERAILLVLGKAYLDRKGDSSLGKLCESEGLAGRYFAVVQERTPTDNGSGEYWLRIIWTDKKESVTIPINGSDGAGAGPVGTAASEADTAGGLSGSDIRAESLPPVSPPLPQVPEWPDVVCIDHNGDWRDALKGVGFLNVIARPFDDFNGEWPVLPSVVVLHGREPGQERSAKSWEKELMKLVNEGRILRVLVASAGGHPEEKKIEHGNGFLWAVKEGEAIQAADMAVNDSAKRGCFLALIQKGESA